MSRFGLKTQGVRKPAACVGHGIEIFGRVSRAPTKRNGFEALFILGGPDAERVSSFKKEKFFL